MAINPYFLKIASILTEITRWGKYLVAFITVGVILINGVKYLQGDASEKSDAIKKIKNTFYMGGGIFFLVWLGQYIVTEFSNVQP